MNQLAKTNDMTFTKDQKLVIRNQIFPEQLTENDFKVFIAFSLRKRLDPIQKQIYAVPRKNGKTGKWTMTIQTSIDGYRAIAARTGQYAGNDDAIFDSELQPKRATVTVYRLIGGVRCPFTATARWDQYYPGDKVGFQWNKMPHVMLGKCAEGLALRKAFPEDLGGIYAENEMEQAIPIDAPIPPAKIEEENAGPEEEVIETSFEDKPDLEMRRLAILTELVGKGKRFGSKAGDAKKWVKKIAGADIMKLNEEQCAKVEGEINATGEEMPPMDDFKPEE